MGETLAEEMKKWCPVNEKAIWDISYFYDEYPDLYWRSNSDSYIANAWKFAVKTWNRYSLREMVKYRYAFPYSFLVTPHNTYYNPYYSALLMSRILLEQFVSPAKCQEFIEACIRVCDKTDSKKNTLLIVSSPSAGKTYFIKPLLNLCWTVGEIRNATKNSDTFIYQEAYNKRIAYWNECVLQGKAEIETAKCVWEGDGTAINVKYQSATILQRTPLIVTANDVPWSHCRHQAKAFRDRCYEFYWKSQPWLLNCRYYPNPLAWKVLLEKYEHLAWWNDVPSTDYFNDKEIDSTSHLFKTWLLENFKEEAEFIINKL